MTTQNGTVWIWFQRLIGGNIWINGGDKLAIAKKKTFFKKSTAKKDAAPKKTTSAVSTVKVKFNPDFIKSLEQSNNVYESNGYNFAACSEIENGSCEQLSRMHSCREGFIGSFRDLLYGNNKLSTQKVSIMVWTNSGNKPTIGAFDNMPYNKWVPSSVKAGLKMVNHFEKRNKWLRTKAYRVDHKYDKGHSLHVFQGSRWWITAPYTLSLFLLLLRLGRHPELHKIAANASNATVVKALKALSSTEGVDKWVVFLDNRRKIFKGRKTFKINFEESKNRNSDGILAFTSNSASDKEALEKFNVCLREAGLSVARKPSSS